VFRVSKNSVTKVFVTLWFCTSNAVVKRSVLSIFEFEFIDKQPMKAGQGLKSSLATQKHRKKMTHIHTNETVKTENEFIKGCISGQKQTRLSKKAQ